LLDDAQSHPTAPGCINRTNTGNPTGHFFQSDPRKLEQYRR